MNSDNTDQNYVKEVAERGLKAYLMLRSYDGTDCVNLHHGDCALPPHPVVRNALREIADTMEVWGETINGESSVELKRYRIARIMTIPELRQVIIDDFAKLMPSDFNRSNVVVHTGGGVTQLTAALFNYFRQLNSTVLMFAPTYTSFLSSALTIGCNIHLVRPTCDGQITPEQIEKAVIEHPEAKAILLINPNNPTGQCFTKEELEKIARLTVKHNLIVISDEIVHKLVFDLNGAFISIASINIDGKSMFERTITLRSVSKDHGLAAVRSGYAIGSTDLMNRLAIDWFTFATTFNVDDLAQYVTIAALSCTTDEYYQAQRDLLRRHRDLVITFIEDINRQVRYKALKPERPPGGIFQIIDASGVRGQVYDGKILENDLILSELLSQEGKEGVALSPASCGGYDPEDMKLRLTLSSPEKDIILGMKRLGKFINNVHRLNGQQ
jgi:aspartate/methionine/tyrosine aminotransferase